MEHLEHMIKTKMYNILYRWCKSHQSHYGIRLRLGTSGGIFQNQNGENK